jgi:hypothetical protein
MFISTPNSISIFISVLPYSPPTHPSLILLWALFLRPTFSPTLVYPRMVVICRAVRPLSRAPLDPPRPTSLCALKEDPSSPAEVLLNTHLNLPSDLR